MGLAEEAGERARLDGRPAEAQDFLSFALEGYRIYASWASSGGEGLARMADVERLEKKLAR